MSENSVIFYEPTIKVKGGKLIFDEYATPDKIWYRFIPDPRWKVKLAAFITRLGEGV